MHNTLSKQTSEQANKHAHARARVHTHTHAHVQFESDGGVNRMNFELDTT